MLLASSEESRMTAFSMAWAASTTMSASAVYGVPTGAAGSLYSRNSTPRTELPRPGSTRLTTQRVATCTESVKSCCSRSGEDLAWTGQIGVQLALPTQRSPKFGSPTAPTGR